MALPSLPLFTITVEVAGLEHMDPDTDVRAALEAGAFMGAQWLQSVWLKVAQGMNIRGGGSGEQSYVHGISAASIVKVAEGVTGGADASILEVIFEIVNTSPHAEFVENGRDAFHLPTAMSWNTPRVKRGKNGPYVHVAFRHAAFVAVGDRGPSGMTMGARRAMMPAEIHEKAKRLMYRMPLLQGPIHSSTGQFIAADRYAWSAQHGPKRIRRGNVRPDLYRQDMAGDHELFNERHGPRVIEKRNGKILGTNPAWKSSKYEGLFKGGTKGGPQYLTVRTITPQSKGWNIPAMPGRHIAARVAAMAQGSSELHDVISAGVRGQLGGGR
jgi:hypothetical protein